MITAQTINREELIKRIEAVNGRRKQRRLSEGDVDLLIETIREVESKPELKARIVRVYPDSAFVPNVYKHRAETPCIDAVLSIEESGVWTAHVHLVDAHRPYASGPKVTVNGRAY